MYSLVFASCLIFPQAVSASWLNAPTDLSLSGGVYTNDTTPTFTWTRPANATWYEYEIDNGDWQSLGNVSTFTTWNLSNGWHTFFVRAHDNYGDVSTSTALTFEIDTVGPTVPAVSPSTAQTNVSTTFTVSPSGESAVTNCWLYVDGIQKTSMTKYSSAFSASYTFTWAGTYTVYARCADGDGNYTTGTTRTVTVSGTSSTNPDSTLYVPTVSPSSAWEDTSSRFTVYPTSNYDITNCWLYVDGSNVKTMEEYSTNYFRTDYTFSNSGSYTVYARCYDSSGTYVNGSQRTVTVYETDGDPATPLSVPSVSLSSTVEGYNTTFSVQPSSDYNVTNCWLYVDGDKVATMTETSTNYFTVNYIFQDSGSYSVYARCYDSSGTYVTGTKRTVTVYSSGYSSNNAHEGDLIKIACGSHPSTNDTCKAVYYYGEDGKRHAFPNESVYYTWYNNFNDVVEISSSDMSDITIGKNVTYRPGSVLVQFSGSSSIYAVEKKHTLRKYTTTSLLKSDYGSNYDDVIVTVPDTLYGNYSIGSVIDSTSDYDRTTQYYSVDSIDDVL